jgi:hypothetical protein
MSNENEQPQGDEDQLDNQSSPDVAEEGTVGVSDAADDAADTDDTADAGAAAEPAASAPAAVEPVPAPVAPAAPVVTPPPAPSAGAINPVLVTGKKISDLTAEEYVLHKNKDLSEISKTVQTIIDRMRTYTTAMAKGNVMGDTNGGQHQRDLYYTILTALQGKEEDLIPSMDAICWFFMAGRKDCFSEGYAFRFMNAVRLDKDELQSFQYLLRVLVSACDPAGRATALKQIDMNRASSKIASLQARDNFLKYFLG